MGLTVFSAVLPHGRTLTLHTLRPSLWDLTGEIGDNRDGDIEGEEVVVFLLFVWFRILPVLLRWNNFFDIDDVPDNGDVDKYEDEVDVVEDFNVVVVFILSLFSVKGVDDEGGGEGKEDLWIFDGDDEKDIIDRALDSDRVIRDGEVWYLLRCWGGGGLFIESWHKFETET